MNNVVRKKNKGFTLTEMIVVIAIIGILAAVLIPSIIGYINRAKQSSAYQEATAVLDVYETWETECEAGITEHKEFGNYYEEIVGKKLPSNMYLKCEGYSDTATIFIYLQEDVIVVINMESNSVSYPKTYDMPDDVMDQLNAGYYKITNVCFR